VILDMLPFKAINNTRNSRSIYRKILVNIFFCFSICSTLPNFYHVIFGKFGVKAFFAFWHCSVQRSVVGVLSRSSPREIQHMVVNSIPVQMATLHSIWSCANKRQEHYMVYFYCKLLPIATKADNVIACFVFLKSNASSLVPRPVFSFSVARANRQDRAVFINRVTRIARYYAKAFRWIRIRVRHYFVPFKQVVLRSLFRFTRSDRFRLFSSIIIAKGEAYAKFVDMENRLSYIFALTLPHRQISKEGCAACSHAPFLLNGSW